MLTSDPYGQIREGGWLRLSAPLVPLLETGREVVPKYPGHGGNLVLSKNRDISVEFDFLLPREQWGEIFALPLAFPCRYDFEYRRALRLFSGLNNKLPFAVWEIHGILVRKTRHSFDSYERVGYFYTLGKTETMFQNPLVTSIILY
jgi:hypothetical protein